MDLVSIKEVIPPRSRVIVAVSGGKDSVALLHALIQQGGGDTGDGVGGAYDLIIAHVNHGLRGEAALRDQLFVAALAYKYRLDLEVLEIDVGAYAKKKKLSVEEAGREARYSYFLKVARKHNADYVVTAHNQDDQAETVLGHLVRGCFLDGLGGMEELAMLAPAEEQRGAVFLYRPLLGVSRRVIDGYLKYHHLPHVEDETNADQRFRRNYLRHTVLPQLARINPRVKEQLAGSAERYRDLDDYLAGLAQSWLDQEGEEFSVLAFNQEHIAFRREILRQLCLRLLGSGAAVSAARLQSGVEFLTKGLTGGRWSLNKQYHLEIEYGLIHIRSSSGGRRVVLPPSKRVELNLNGVTAVGGKNLVIRKHPKRELSFRKDGEKSHLQAFIDGAKLQGKKLYLRFWRPGDRFVPLGMQGQKKLQDFFVDLKVSRRERRHIPLIVTEEDEIVWVVGYRLDDRYKLAAKSKEVWEISWQA